MSVKELIRKFMKRNNKIYWYYKLEDIYSKVNYFSIKVNKKDFNVNEQNHLQEQEAIKTIVAEALNSDKKYFKEVSEEEYKANVKRKRKIKIKYERGE